MSKSKCPDLFGGSLVTETEHASRSMNGTTQLINTGTKESENSLSGQAKSYALEPQKGILFSYGENSKTTVDKLELTAPFSEAKARTARLSLSSRLTLSLIIAGLVKGITPTSIRRRCGAPIQDIVSWSRDGGDAE